MLGPQSPSWPAPMSLPFSPQGGVSGGFVIPVLDKNQFTFTGQASGATIDINVAQNIDSTQWVVGTLFTRVYAQATYSSTANVVVWVVNSFIGSDDPATIFSPATVSSTFVAKSSAITSSTAAGILDVQPLNQQPMGPFLRVFVEYSQGATAMAAAA